MNLRARMDYQQHMLCHVWLVKSEAALLHVTSVDRCMWDAYSTEDCEMTIGNKLGNWPSQKKQSGT